MNKRYYEHTLPIIRGSLSNTYYQIIILSINFTTKFEEEPHGIKIIPTKKYFSGTN